MLVLSRKKGERVIIELEDGEDIVVQVMEVGDRVRLGFQARSSIYIRRNEVPSQRKPADESKGD